MECAPPPVDLDVKHEPSSLKRKYDRAMQQQADLYQSTDELEKWLHTSGVLEAAIVGSISDAVEDAPMIHVGEC